LINAHEKWAMKDNTSEMAQNTAIAMGLPEDLRNETPNKKQSRRRA
jgi:hypothetical protein